MEFYDLALAKLLEGFPELGSFIVTFKDLSDELNDTDDVQVGAFVLSANSDIFYIPVVSKGSSVYPLDSVFVNSKEKFFPLTKKVINLLISTPTNSPGKSTKIPQGVAQNPDMSQFINPPRTGKFVYASQSRLHDFLSAMPDKLKEFTLAKFAEEKSLYTKLHSMFGFDTIAQDLIVKKASQNKVEKTFDPNEFHFYTEKVAGMPEEAVNELVKKGYFITGTPETNRVAVSVMSAQDGKFQHITQVDGNKDYEIVLANGSTREAYVPKLLSPSIGADDTKEYRGSRYGNVPAVFAIFTNGDYTISYEGVIAVGDPLPRVEVLRKVFHYSPPLLPSDLSRNDDFAIIAPTSEVIGVFLADSVTLSHLGVEIKGTNRITGSSVRIYAYKNFNGTFQYETSGSELYIPYSSLVLKLGTRLYDRDLEVNINSAQIKSNIAQRRFLDNDIRLGFDGVEFSVNGRPIGGEAQVVRLLVVDEGIAPNLATSFVKEARENRFTRIYLTKKAANADFPPAEIPQFGAQVPKSGEVRPNGAFVPNAQLAANTEDPQLTEAMIISELLQVPDMFELIGEYLPTIEEAIDKLGRILFVSRVHLEKLALGNDVDSIFGFLSSLKTVYKLLGDNMLKLRELVSVQPQVRLDADEEHN